MTTPHDLLQPLIIAAKTPAQCRALAVELERIAALCRQYADARERQQAKPPRERLSGGGKGGRPSQPWIQVLARPRPGMAENLVIRLSTSLYYAAGSPERLDVQRVDGRLVLIPARGDHGYKVMVNAGGIRIAAAGSRDVVRLEEGKYAAEMRAGVIEVGARL